MSDKHVIKRAKYKSSTKDPGVPGVLKLVVNLCPTTSHYVMCVSFSITGINGFAVLYWDCSTTGLSGIILVLFLNVLLCTK